jgi:exodeoxyribonuclease VII small subunit
MKSARILAGCCRNPAPPCNAVPQTITRKPLPNIDRAANPGQACAPHLKRPNHVTTKKSKDKDIDSPDLEKSLAELESIVEKLEAGDLTLDESLKQFERGVQLTRHCQTALRKAEQKVDILLKKNGLSNTDDDVAPFDSASTDEDEAD